MTRPTLNVDVAVQRPDGDAIDGLHFSPGDIDKAWCTSVTVDRKGALILWKGHTVQHRFGYGEWASYTVQLAPEPPLDPLGLPAASRVDPDADRRGEWGSNG